MMPAAASADVPPIDELLRRRGLRATRQRRLVADAVRQLGHATPEQVHEVASVGDGSLNLSTVYRTLELLQDLGVLTHTHLSHTTVTYHLAVDQPHAHLVCRRCGAVTELAPELGSAFEARVADRHGFGVDLGHLAVHGLCGACS